jgi:hypothetical protein
MAGATARAAAGRLYRLQRGRRDARAPSKGRENRLEPPSFARPSEPKRDDGLMAHLSICRT